MVAHGMLSLAAGGAAGETPALQENCRHFPFFPGSPSLPNKSTLW